MSATSYIPDSELEAFLVEDAPYGDLTTELLGIGGASGVITFRTRHRTAIACTEEAARLLEKAGCRASVLAPSGTMAEAGRPILEATGSAPALHLGWKVAVNLLEGACGIATRTHTMVTEARRANPDISVVSTRKIFPGTKRIATKAVYAGGASPHRLGLSETILVFDHHRAFLGGMDGFLARLSDYRREASEKMLAVEVSTLDEALLLANTGVDILQVDKLKPPQLAELVKAVRATGSIVKISAAGGINQENAYEYASAGVDILVTSSMYWGKPADIGVTILPV
jgi:molybdenum transport protein